MIADLLQASLRDPAVYDELSADGIEPRPHWAGLIESLQAIGSEELAKRWARAERRIRENGVMSRNSNRWALHYHDVDAVFMRILA
jgi:uncharacterized circularly permuted ATP-grasp superfamily protein